MAEHVQWHESVLEDPYSRWLMKLLVNGNYENFKGYEHKIRPTREDYQKYLDKTAPRELGAHITIALPKPTDKTPEDIKEKLQSCSTITDYIFTYEFYSQEGNNFNPHIHIFVYGDQHKSNIIKLFSRFFKIKPNFVDFKKTFNKTQRENVINYIKGNKCSEAKHVASMMDIKYREEHNLENYYLN